MRRITIAIAIVAAFGLGLLLRGGGTASDAAPAAATPAPTVWTCSMHPRIRLPEPGQCPICFMDLIPLEDEAGEEAGPRALSMSAAAAALAEIRTTPVARRAVAPRIRLGGEVEVDETRFRTISAWVAGRIDTLFVDYTGSSVARGEPLVSLYSPGLYAAQVELLNARSAADELRRSSDSRLAETATATVTAARERLRRWGLSEAQVAAVESRGEARSHVRLSSPLGGVVVRKDAIEGGYVETGTPLFMVADLSHVWVALDAYESDLPWVAEGGTVEFTVAAVPGRSFAGVVDFVDPVLDTSTRTALVRLDVDNADGVLKPGMFVDAEFSAAPAGGEVPLVIPATAPLITGTRAVVYVRVPDLERPTFEGREIELGPRAGDVYVVASGLEEGDLVVTNGAFKIDSAMQIQAKPSLMNPEVERVDAPPAFRAGLIPLVEAVTELSDALAADDDVAASAAADRAAAAVDAVDMSRAGSAHEAWMADAAALRRALERIAAADGIAARRAPLQELSDRTWDALRRYGYADDRPLRLFHCPMAYDGKGGDWIQRGTETANPYYGSQMLRCGSQTDTLAVVAGAER